MHKEETVVDGHCYCSAIAFEVRIPASERPYFSLYCHCESCRRAHASPLYHVVCVSGEMLKITRGEKLVKKYRKPGGKICRAFCGRCGTRVLNFYMNSDTGNEPVAFFPNLLDSKYQENLPAIFKPTHNNSLEQCVLNYDLLSSDVSGSASILVPLSQTG